MGKPYRGTFHMLPALAADYIIKAAHNAAPLRWLATEARSTADFSALIEVCRPNTDDPRVLGALAALQQTRTLLNELLYDRGEKYDDGKTFLTVLGQTNLSASDLRNLEAVQTDFEPLLELLTKKSRSPGVQACYDLKSLCESGTFVISCAAHKNDQISCRAPGGKPWKRQELMELRQQLFMTDVPEELQSQALSIHGRTMTFQDMIADFLEKLPILDDYSACTQELFSLGHFGFKLSANVLEVSPVDTAEMLSEKLEQLQDTLDEWESAVITARGEHYYLNYFTAYELRNLARTLPAATGNGVLADMAMHSTMQMLRTIAPQAS